MNTSSSNSIGYLIASLVFFSIALITGHSVMMTDITSNMSAAEYDATITFLIVMSFLCLSFVVCGFVMLWGFYQMVKPNESPYIPGQTSNDRIVRNKGRVYYHKGKKD